MNEDVQPNNDIAIIGMAGRFPQAATVAEFWRNLCAGREGISFFGDDASYAKNGGHRLINARGILDQADCFDAEFFGIKPREAQVMDPQHRVFLECAWTALEDAGYDALKFDGAIGVFAGMSMNTYLAHNLVCHPDLVAMVGDYQLMLGNDKDYLPTRVSYKLGLTGPSLNIQTACSTSLVAVCTACQYLLSYQCDTALAGAVSVRFPQKQGYNFQQGSIASPDGHCRAFDAKAAGTVPGEGVGIVVLKRCDDAIADGDFIYAVIKGFAINNDGSNKVGYTAPGVEGQAAVIAQAHAMAGIEPGSIGYVEAHGTGTPLGDPVEVEALSRVFGEGTSRKNFCALGTVKSNIGHLDAAAGVAGLIKAALSLHHEKIPASLHFEQPNPEIDFANSPFFVNAALREWPRQHVPRRAGVSSFGIGGTNAHVVLEEAPRLAESKGGRAAQLLTWSAKTPGALDALTQQIAEWTASHPSVPLADVAYTLRLGRRDFAHRRMLVCETAQEAAAVLADADKTKVLEGVAKESPTPVMFLFPGQGAQRVNMGRELYETEPEFRRHVETGCEILAPMLGLDLRGLLFPKSGNEEQAQRKLNETEITQPALFLMEYALARLWMAWGVTPAGMIGHSIGEYVAACLAGVFSFPAALNLVAERGRLMSRQPRGAMLAVRIPEAQALQFTNSRISLAAVNGATACVFSGPVEAIEALKAKLAEQQIAATVLLTSHAFHSQMMEPAVQPFRELVASVELHKPEIPFISNVTGSWIRASEATDPSYWAQHLRQTVRFNDGLAELLKDENQVLLEAGPGQILSNLTKQHPKRAATTTVCASLSKAREQSDLKALLGAAGQLWLAGAELDWRAFYAGERRRRVPLPTYPFARTRHWIEPAVTSATSESPASAATLLSSELSTHSREDIASASPDAARSEGSEQQIVRELRAMLKELSGLDLSAVSEQTTFAEMGFESLFLTQASLTIEKRFGVRVAFRQLLEDANCLAGIASFIASQSPNNRTQASRASLRTGLSGYDSDKEDTSDSVTEISIVPDNLDFSKGIAGASRTPATDSKELKELPLTAAQREIWFASQRGDAASCAYNECRAIEFRGALDFEALRAAIGDLVRRHEALRITFAANGSVQYVHPAMEPDIQRMERTGLDEAARAAAADEIQVGEARQPFDVVKGPLVRARVIHFAPDHHVLVLTIHHLVCDGHSFAQLLRELIPLYLRRKGDACPEPAPAAQFSEYAVRRTPKQNLAEAERFWTGLFETEPAALELPKDFPDGPEWNFEGAREERELGEKLLSGLKELGAARGCTLFTVMLAAWGVLLRRLSGQSDVVIGVPIAERPDLQDASVVGHCTNFLPVRMAVSDTDRFSEHLGNIQRLFLDAYEHHAFTFGSVLEKLKLNWKGDRMPLLSVTLNLEPEAPELKMPGCEVSVSSTPHLYTNFDLTLNLIETGARLRMECRYNKTLYAPETIRRWLGHFETLLASAVREPNSKVADLEILNAAQRHTVLVGWNQTDVKFDSASCIHEFISQQAARTPDKTAVAFNDESMTYAQLDRAAEQVARELRSFGVGPEVRAGICVERSLEMMIGLLGILKAGGAYVPLDPSYPQERVLFMLRDSGAPVLVTQSHLASYLNPGGSSVKTLLLDGPRSNRVSAGPAQASSSPNLAYVIYTSGSTGMPKGVGLTHRNVANFFCGMDQLLGTKPGVWLAVTSISFDISVLELFWTLARGFTVVIQADERRTSVQPVEFRSIADNLARHGVTHFQCTPSQMRGLLLSPEWLKAAGSLKQVLVGGEALPADVGARLLEVVPSVTNMYGPTETTVWSTAKHLGGDTWQNSIGRPIANTKVYILDSNRRPVPVGVAGEIYIGGEGVARGYLNSPELTAKKFLANPFASDSSERIYRTGDRGRFRQDGEIEFLGRMDGQVKIRGHRIELGEVEAALRGHPQVRDAAVVVRKDGDDARLQAYVVAEPGVDAVALRHYLDAKLPGAMIPAGFTFLDALPLTPNGKVDRRALATMTVESLEAVPPEELPESTAETIIADIWREVLGVEAVGVNDNFFEKGGHSMMMIQTIARIRREIGVDLPLRRFFETPTIAGLAAAVEQLLGDESNEGTEEELAADRIETKEEFHV